MRENNQLSCRATVTPISLDVSASFEHLTELNFTGVFFDAAKNVMSEKEYEEYGRQLVHLFEELKEMADAGEYELVKKSMPALCQRKRLLYWQCIHRLDQQGCTE